MDDLPLDIDFDFDFSAIQEDLQLPFRESGKVSRPAPMEPQHLVVEEGANVNNEDTEVVGKGFTDGNVEN